MRFFYSVLRWLFCSFFLAATAFGQQRAIDRRSGEFFDSLPCRDEVGRLVSSWKSLEEWSPILGSDTQVLGWHTPGKDLGTRISVSKNGPEAVEIVLDTETDRFEAKVSKRACEPEVSIYKQASPERSKYLKYFGTPELKRLLERNSQGVIFAWSPHMPLSLKALDELRNACKKAGLPIEIVMDPMADASDAKRSAAKYKIPVTGLQRLESLDLIQRDLGQHYPSVLVFSKGRLNVRALKGHKTEEDYLIYIQETLERLR
jgi:hypothetical protein